MGPSSLFWAQLILSKAIDPQGIIYRNRGTIEVSFWVNSEKSAPCSSPFFPTSEISRIGPSRKSRDVKENEFLTRRRYSFSGMVRISFLLPRTSTLINSLRENNNFLFYFLRRFALKASSGNFQLNNKGRSKNRLEQQVIDICQWINTSNES